MELGKSVGVRAKVVRRSNLAIPLRQVLKVKRAWSEFGQAGAKGARGPNCYHRSDYKLDRCGFPPRVCLLKNSDIGALSKQAIEKMARGVRLAGSPTVGAKEYRQNDLALTFPPTGFHHRLPHLSLEGSAAALARRCCFRCARY